MIARLQMSSPNFKSNEHMSVRDAFKAELDENSKTAQVQNTLATNMNGMLMNKQVAMQGGQKLDVMA